MPSYFGPSLGFRGRGGAVPALPAAAPGSGGSSAAPHSLAPPTQSKISIFFSHVCFSHVHLESSCLGSVHCGKSSCSGFAVTLGRAVCATL